MNYSVTTDVSKATHWLSYQDDESPVKKHITPNKFYKIKKLKEKFQNIYGEEIEDEEYFIKSEDGFYSMYYIAHNGDFVIVEGATNEMY